jgi:hypothetical protein
MYEFRCQPVGRNFAGTCGHDGLHARKRVSRLLNDQKSESTLPRRTRHGFAALLLVAGILSLYFSPIAWPLAVAYTCLGLIAGALMNLDDRAAGVVGLLLLFCVASAPFVSWIGARWQQAWWHAGILALAGVAIAHLSPPIIRRFRQR